MELDAKQKFVGGLFIGGSLLLGGCRGVPAPTNSAPSEGGNNPNQSGSIDIYDLQQFPNGVVALACPTEEDQELKSLAVPSHTVYDKGINPPYPSSCDLYVIFHYENATCQVQFAYDKDERGQKPTTEVRHLSYPNGSINLSDSDLLKKRFDKDGNEVYFPPRSIIISCNEPAQSLIITDTVAQVPRNYQLKSSQTVSRASGMKFFNNILEEVQGNLDSNPEDILKNIEGQIPGRTEIVIDSSSKKITNMIVYVKKGDNLCKITFGVDYPDCLPAITSARVENYSWRKGDSTQLEKRQLRDESYANNQQVRSNTIRNNSAPRYRKNAYNGYRIS